MKEKIFQFMAGRNGNDALNRFLLGAVLVLILLGTIFSRSAVGRLMLPVALVTKDQKIRPFRRTTVVYGKPMTPEELHLTGDKPDLRYATRTLSAVIAGLIEEGRR